VSHSDVKVFSFEYIILKKKKKKKETIPVQQLASLSSTSPRTLDLALWHWRLCHHHLVGDKKLLSGNLVTGFFFFFLFFLIL
jgi:hypothetical protein